MTDTANSGEAGATRRAGQDRKARLADELRANLQRRKAQVRSRRTGEADLRADGLAAAPQGSAPRATTGAEKQADAMAAGAEPTETQDKV